MSGSHAGNSGFNWPDLLATLVAREDLGTEATAWAMGEILSGNATPTQIAGFSVALRAKGESVAELTGLANTMFDHAIQLTVSDRVLDIVGTGGDRAQTVNISSMAAVVIAGAGVGVIKHGNRAASSKSGSADVLEALGLHLDLPVDHVLDVYHDAGITFCFAPLFHSSLRHAGAPRRELGIPTPFNWLGPLTNPANPAAMAVGCANPAIAPIMAGVFAGRGTDALVFRGDDGLDELTVCATSRVWVVADGDVSEENFDPRTLDIPFSTIEDLRGGDATYNADVFRRIIAGEKGPIRDAVLLNAAAGIAAHEAADGTLEERLAAGFARATESIDSGAADTTLAGWAEASQRYASAG